MIKVRLSSEKIIKLQRGNKIISRSELDYGSNKKMYDFRGFKPVQDNVKEVKEVQFKQENVVKLKPKKTTRKKKNEQVVNIQDKEID
tara:strand:+ start:311 stop:571 length:261 start_codon:yes stop_codon:yes gene_type:complete